MALTGAQVTFSKMLKLPPENKLKPVMKCPRRSERPVWCGFFAVGGLDGAT